MSKLKKTRTTVNNVKLWILFEEKPRAQLALSVASVSGNPEYFSYTWVMCGDMVGIWKIERGAVQ